MPVANARVPIRFLHFLFVFPNRRYADLDRDQRIICLLTPFKGAPQADRLLDYPRTISPLSAPPQ